MSPVEGRVAVSVDIDGAFGAAKFPEGGMFPLVGEEGLAALVEDAAVLQVFRLAVGGVAEGGAQDADRVLAVAALRLQNMR